MGANAGAEVVVANADEAEGLASIVGQLPEVYLQRHFSPLHKLVADGQVLRNHLIDAALNLMHLLLRGAGVEEVVALALLPFDMRIP